jgi:superfamily II DNA or RNA helicase
VCPDGRVHNIEVEDNNNYFVHGLLVHNCHLSASPTFLKVMNHFTGAKFVIGLSATPYRLDGKPLYGPGGWFGDGGHRLSYPLEGLRPGTRIHEAVAFKYTLPVAIKNGHLADVVAVPCELSFDLKGIRISKGAIQDFNRHDLEDRIGPQVEALANIVRMHLDRLGIKRALLFAPGIRSARAISDAFKQIGVPSAAVWTGNKENPLPDLEKKEILDSAKEGRYRVLCCSDLLIEGYDDEELQAVIMARPTQSLGRANQMIGRGTRILPHKPRCYVIGFEWQGARGAVSSIDILLDEEPDGTAKERAKSEYKRRSEAGEDVDLMDLIEEAKEYREPERVRIAASKKEVKHRYREFSPFNASDLLGVAVAPDRARAKLDPPTAAQLAVLADYGLKRGSCLDRAGADRLIAECLEREFRRKAAPEQVRKLVQQGHAPEQARELDKAVADKILGHVSERMANWLRWKGVDPNKVTKQEAARLYGRSKEASRR